MEQIVIRNYRDTDRKYLAELFENSLDYFGEIDPLKIIQKGKSYGDWSVTHALNKISKGGVILVATDGNEVVGFVVGTIHPLSEEEQMELKPIRYGTIEELHVNLKFRNRGIGTKLIQMIEEYFKENECEYSKLYVFDSNVDAKRRYENLNYKTRIKMMIKKI